MKECVTKMHWDFSFSLSFRMSFQPMLLCYTSPPFGLVLALLLMLSGNSFNAGPRVVSLGVIINPVMLRMKISCNGYLTIMTWKFVFWFYLFQDLEVSCMFVFSFFSSNWGNVLLHFNWTNSPYLPFLLQIPFLAYGLLFILWVTFRSIHAYIIYFSMYVNILFSWTNSSSLTFFLGDFVHCLYFP